MSKLPYAVPSPCPDRPAVLLNKERRRAVSLKLRLFNVLLNATGVADVERLSEAEIIADQKPLPRNIMTDFLFGKAAKGVTIRTATIPCEIHDIPARIHEQATEEASGRYKGRPAVLYLHGGGWVSGDAGMSDWWCSNVALQTGAVVIAIDYRLAPAHRFPAPIDDGRNALRWMHDNASELGLDIDRISVAGDSAGANLAAALCIDAINRNAARIASQILIYPALDLTLRSPSLDELADAPLLTTRAVSAYVGHYLNGYSGHAEAASNPLVSPLFARNVATLPRTLIQVGEHDPLRDDGWRYAHRLEVAGVAVRITEYAGAPHGFVSFPGLTVVAKAALDEACTFLDTVGCMVSPIKTLCI